MACRFSAIGAPVASARYTKTMADARTPRWYRLTPDRVVVALLALEFVLLLSAWFQWFAFNRHKGWSVLVAIAGVGLALLLMFLWFLAALIFRWRFQFSIRALLLLVVVVAIPFSWLETEIQQARKQRVVVEWIVNLRGFAFYDYELDPSGDPIPGAKPPGPAWLRNLLGDDLLANVAEVYLTNSNVGDADLEHLKGLTQLRFLDLGGTKVGDVGLEHLSELTHLEWLDAGTTNVTDVGLKRLKGLTRLRKLFLWYTKTSDAGLEYLKGFTQLQWLYLDGTNVTDAGLQRLKGLKRLQILGLARTNVTYSGVQDFRDALPNVFIER